jgi:hypothetical protein
MRNIGKVDCEMERNENNGRVTDEEEEGTDNCCRMKGSCDAHKVQEETKGEEHGTGRRGVID